MQDDELLAESISKEHDIAEDDEAEIISPSYAQG